MRRWCLLLVVAVGYVCLYLCVVRWQLSSLSTRLSLTLGTAPQSPWPEPGAALRCLEAVVTVEPGGRLANQLFELASAWAVASELGLPRLRVPLEVLTAARGTYGNLQALVSLEEELGHGECRRLGLNTSYVFQHALPEGLERDIRPYAAWADRERQPIVLRRWIVHLESIVPRLEQLRKEWRAWPHIEDTVQTHMNKMRQVVTRKHGGNKTVVFVSVHVRRGDYEGLLRNKWNVTKSADVPYFRRAVRRMRELLRGDQASPEVSLAVVVASDDPYWCQLELLPVLREDLKVGGGGLPAGEVFESPFWLEASPAYDLELLSSCDHSVLSYGTFGLWGALRAGGRAVFYDLLNPHARVPNFVSDLSHWFPTWETMH